jgi:hypothetical protein
MQSQNAAYGAVDTNMGYTVGWARASELIHQKRLRTTKSDTRVQDQISQRKEFNLTF